MTSNNLLHILDLEETHFDNRVDFKFSDFNELGRYSYTVKSPGFPLLRDSTDFVLPLDVLPESLQTTLSTQFNMKLGLSSFWYVYPSYHSNRIFVGNFNEEPTTTDLQATGETLTGLFVDSPSFSVEIAGLNTGKDTRDAISTTIFGEILPDNVFVFNSSCFKVPTISVAITNRALPKACVGVLVGINWEALYAHPEYDNIAERLSGKITLLSATLPSILHNELFKSGPPDDGGVVDDSNGGAVDDGNGGVVDDSNGGAVDDGNGGAVDDGNGGAVDDGNGGAVDDGNGGAVDDGNGGAVDDGNGGTVDDGNGGTVDDGNGGVVDDGNGGAVDDGTVDNGGIGTGTIVGLIFSGLFALMMIMVAGYAGSRL